VLYRRKLLLALLQALDRDVDHISFQKLLFLLTQRQHSKSFDFIPYRFGCFSFQANSEMKVLVRDGLLQEINDTWKIITRENWVEQLQQTDKVVLGEIVREFGDWSKDKLIYWTYTNYPYYSINSEIVDEHLNESEKLLAETARPNVKGTVLFTTGYEGLSLEGYLNRLIQEGVRLLCDVRKNPASMKYGFARKTLEKACQGVHIEYRHFPELGIDGKKRKNLETKEDYDNLFEMYKRDILPNVIKKREEVLDLVKSHERVALTCFEADHRFCHRSHLASALAGQARSGLEVKHL
jgi:hypothetical protein